MKVYKLYILLVTSVTILVAGCADQATCIPENTDLLQISFVDTTGNVSDFSLVTVEAVGSNENFPIIQNSTFKTLAIPLNPVDNKIKLNFIQGVNTYELVVSYRANKILLAPECGFESLFDQVKVDSSNFINAIVVNQTLNKDIKTNVQITH